MNLFTKRFLKKYFKLKHKWSSEKFNFLKTFCKHLNAMQCFLQTIAVIEPLSMSGIQFMTYGKQSIDH